jgi:hypothetical protein
MPDMVLDEVLAVAATIRRIVAAMEARQFTVTEKVAVWDRLPELAVTVMVALSG